MPDLSHPHNSFYSGDFGPEMTDEFSLRSIILLVYRPDVR